MHLERAWVETMKRGRRYLRVSGIECGQQELVFFKIAELKGRRYVRQDLIAGRRQLVYVSCTVPSLDRDG
jgi:hypothetical protein